MSSENVSNRIQSKVNAANQFIKVFFRGLLMIAASGVPWSSGPVASVELANLGKTAAACQPRANATGYYYAADTLKTMTNAGINFLSKDNLSGWCSLTNETLLKGDRPFEEMWKEGITVGGFGVVFGGVGGAALKSSSSIIKGIGITGVTAGLGFLGKDILYDREQEVEKAGTLKESLYNSKDKRCADAIAEIRSGQLIDVKALALGLGSSPKAIKKINSKKSLDHLKNQKYQKYLESKNQNFYRPPMLSV